MRDQLPTHDRPEVHAILGPTNTGKTHLAIERMLRHRSGVIGLPLRLLAREVYERISARRGPDAVALITGEEKISPANARYQVCTTEAMSSSPGTDFVAVDEIQVAADPERGHVFTDRLLRARGYRETLFLGSASMSNRIRQLVPEARISGRNRFSTLSYGGRMRLEALPPRAAIVAFSAADVYEIASLVRRRRGGAAVVLGALSPQTRNAQVELFQSGEVDTIVATDAIGMGLNLDIDMVAFTRLSKFDGERVRRLRPEEVGQIAGRAGRHRRPGSFAVADWEEELQPAIARAVEEQQFPSIPVLRWRNSELDFANLHGLLDSLQARPPRSGLVRPREGSDLRALQILANDRSVLQHANGPEAVKLLWNACRIPDYPSIAAERHAALVRDIFFALASSRGALTDDWMSGALARINTRSDDIDALAISLENARTCQYIANQADWLPDPNHWRERTRAVEDQISDSLHRRLVDLFVDARATKIARLARQGRKPVASVEDNGAVAVEGAIIGRLDGFQFRPERSSGIPPTEAEARAANDAAQDALSARIQAFLSADGSAIEVKHRSLLWRGESVAVLSRGDDALRPQVQAVMADIAGPEDRKRVQLRLQNHLDAMLRRELAPLFALRGDETLTPAARGIAYRITEMLGILPRSTVMQEIRALPQEERKLLRAHGVRFGSRYVFVPALLKPAPTRLRHSLWYLATDPASLPEPPTPGLVNIPADPEWPGEYLRICGFHRCGARAVRIDMVERLLDLIRQAEKLEEWFAGTLDMLSITGSSLEDLREIMSGLGYESEPIPSEPAPDREEPLATDAEVEPAPSGSSIDTAVPNEESASGTGADPVPVPAFADSAGDARESRGDGSDDSESTAPATGYRFRRKPRRKPENRRRPGKAFRAGGREPGRKRAQSGNRTTEAKHRKKAAEKESRKRRVPDKHQRTQEDTPGIDPNSPFAVLANLKFNGDRDTSVE